MKTTKEKQKMLAAMFVVVQLLAIMMYQTCLFTGSLASLVYQHSITPLALPCKLVLPEAGECFLVLYLTLLFTYKVSLITIVQPIYKE